MDKLKSVGKIFGFGKEDEEGIVNNDRGEQQRHRADSNGSSENNDPIKEKRKNGNLHDNNGSSNSNGNNGNSGNGNGNHHRQQPTYNAMNNPYLNAPHAMDAATAVMGVGGDRRPERPRSDSGQQLPEFQFLSSNHMGSGGKVCPPPNRSLDEQQQQQQEMENSEEKN